jgi:hypothetical protein
MASMATVRNGQRALAAGKYVGNLRHHVSHQEQHDGDGDERDDGGVQRRAHQPRVERLPLLEIGGQPLQHQSEVAALFAGAHHGREDIGELARETRQRLAEGRAGVDLGAQRGHQMPLALVFGFVGQRRQGPLQRQARADESGQLAGPDRQPRRVEDRPAEHRAVPAEGLLAGRGAGSDSKHLQRHQRLRAQHAAHGLGGIGLHDAAAGLALGVQGLEGIGGHGEIMGFAVFLQSSSGGGKKTTKPVAT